MPRLCNSCFAERRWNYAPSPGPREEPKPLPPLETCASCGKVLGVTDKLRTRRPGHCYECSNAPTADDTGPARAAKAREASPSSDSAATRTTWVPDLLALGGSAALAGSFFIPAVGTWWDDGARRSVSLANAWWSLVSCTDPLFGRPCLTGEGLRMYSVVLLIPVVGVVGALLALSRALSQSQQRSGVVAVTYLMLGLVGLGITWYGTRTEAFLWYSPVPWSEAPGAVLGIMASGVLIASGLFSGPGVSGRRVPRT